MNTDTLPLKAVRLTVLLAALAVVLALALQIVQAIDAPPDLPSDPGEQAAYRAEVETYQDRARWYSVGTVLGASLMDAALPVAIVALALAALARRRAPTDAPH